MPWLATIRSSLPSPFTSAVATPDARDSWAARVPVEAKLDAAPKLPAPSPQQHGDGAGRVDDDQVQPAVAVQVPGGHGDRARPGGVGGGRAEAATSVAEQHGHAAGVGRRR